MNGTFPDDSAERKTYPVYSGLLQYFPSALAKIAHHSYLGNEKHNPGQPLHHDRAKSGDEPDALVRHLMEGDLVGCAWRALSLLQKDCEAKGAPIAPAARNARTPAAKALDMVEMSPPVISRDVVAAVVLDLSIQRGERDDDAEGEPVIAVNQADEE